MELSQLEIPNFVVVDGSRIGLNDYEPITSRDSRAAGIRGYADKIYANLANTLVDCFNPHDPHDRSLIPCNLDEPQPLCAFGCGFELICGQPKAPPEETLPSSTNNINEANILTSSNITVNGKVWALDSPPLDIVAQPRVPLYGADTIPREHYMSHHHVSFSSAYLRDNVLCLPAAYYRWGFSSLLLLLFCLLTSLFATILVALHEDAFWNSRADRYRYDVNHYKDAVDLVIALEQDHISMQNTSARALKQELEKDVSRGVWLDTSELPSARRADAIRKRKDLV